MEVAERGVELSAGATTDLHSKEEIGEFVILEQLLQVLPYDSRTWVKEHEPESGLAATKLAQQYVNAHRFSLRTQPVKGKACYAHTDKLQEAPQELKTVTPHKLICFSCQQLGHKASLCPARKSKLTGFCYAPREENIEIDSVGMRQVNNMLMDITVNRRSLKALLDTGSSLSLIKTCHVSNVDYANTTDVQCVHGDVMRYPKVEVLVGVQEQMYLLNVAVVTSLPADIILGRDLTIVSELVKEKGNWDNENAIPECAFPVMTRAQAKADLCLFSLCQTWIIVCYRVGPKAEKDTSIATTVEIPGYSSPQTLYRGP